MPLPFVTVFERGVKKFLWKKVHIFLNSQRVFPIELLMVIRSFIRPEAAALDV